LAKIALIFVDESLIMVSEKIIKTNGISFALKIWGEQSLPKILAIHGWLDNAASFDLLAPLLNNYCVIAMDQCGHGKSDHRPFGVPYHFVDYVADAFHVADALGLKDFILLGHSLGANVATTMAGTMPERIKALILIEGFGPATRDIEQTTLNLRESIEKFSKNNSKKRRYAELLSLVKARLQGRWPLTEEAAQLLCERGSLEKDGKFTWSSDPRINFTSPLRMSAEQAAFVRTQIMCPIQIIIGEQGIAPQVSENKPPLSDFKTNNTNVTVTRLPGFHHLHMHRTHVGSVAQILNTFLNAQKF
jgi:pimeloyl-ACP methyl ester carboxylesterase